MGHGIGLVSAQAGYEVVAVEAKPDALEAGKKRIDGSLKKLLSKVGRSVDWWGWVDLVDSVIEASTFLSSSCMRQSVEKGKLTADAAAAEAKAVQGRIKYSLDLKDLKDADLVIEVCALCVFTCMCVLLALCGGLIF